MELKVNFAETDQTFNAPPVEESQTFNTDMDDAVVLPGGENGATFTPTVSEDGVISWSNDKGLPNPASVDISGKDGKDGADGKDGKTVQWYFAKSFPSNVTDYNDGDIIVDVWNGYVFIANHSTGQFEFTSLILQGMQGENGKDGISVDNAYIKYDGELIVGLSDGNEIRCGYIVPEKGVHYFTETDKAEMVASVISALPVYGGEVESV